MAMDTTGCDDVCCPPRCFAVERLGSVGNQRCQDGARIPIQLKSQICLKGACADRNWKFDVRYAKRDELPKIELEGAGRLVLPPTFYGDTREPKKRTLLLEGYNCGVAKRGRHWLNEHGNSDEVFSQLTTSLRDVFSKADSTKRMEMTERVASVLRTFEPALGFTSASESKR
ncbi:hypothetical protein Tcan_08295 [Toxocara canis]|uniref:Uncharacterized protein n=1 Tax=Toxocara canis TaxID=6265 RepID=A0A0B2UYX9_TOXCA|nr:hypothetical protein Tcan_08295 [Toxocara canis]